SSRISGVDIDKLSPRARFNFALRDLRDALTAAKTPQDAEKAILAPAAKAARVGKPMEIDFDKLGPRAVTGGAVDWSVSVLDGGEVATYRAATKNDPRSEELTLVFRRVKPSAASRASWVMTHEVSLGAFASLITASAKWSELRSGRLLTDYDPDRGDPRLGPRIWEWPKGRVRAASAGIKPSYVWLSDDV